MVRGVRKTLDSVRRSLLSRLSGGTRRQLAIKDGEIAALRRQLSLVGGGDGSITSGGFPVFFVLGYQKSGTTWLMHMLDAHPEILCRGEGRFFDGGWRQKNLKRDGIERPASSLYHALLDAEYLRL
ncbi:MAG: sulfotransferase, partial [Actinomycetota bacterium]|nr:sulfotransferase [Actinomycetota bacterium]